MVMVMGFLILVAQIFLDILYSFIQSVCTNDRIWTRPTLLGPGNPVVKQDRPSPIPHGFYIVLGRFWSFSKTKENFGSGTNSSHPYDYRRLNFLDEIKTTP
jgi:hypothetical protein